MEQEPIARTALDEMVESDQDQMLKAMIPYLPSPAVLHENVPNRNLRG